MATLVLTNTKVYAGEFDTSGQLNQVALNYAAEALNDTTFGSGGTKTHKGGRKSVDLSLGGFVDEGASLIGEYAFSRIGTADVPVTVVPQGGSVADIAHFFKAMKTSYPKPIQHGQLYAFSLNAVASNGPLVRGQIFIAAGNKTSSGSASAVQLGTLSASQRMYASLHVLSASGTSPTLDVVVYSDDNAGFSSSTARITFTQATGVTSALQSVAGAVTDDYWTVGYTIGGSSTPTFSFVVALGIGPA